MRPNPYRLTLSWLGFGLATLGLLLIAIGSSMGPDAIAPGAVVVAVGGTLLGFGGVAIVGWLVVAAIQWAPVPAKPRDASADAEYEEIKRRERDPNGLG